MAVSKRLRYEVLRRDNYTCRYCGHSAPEVEVTVDHVIPKALGGSDEPSNLCAACGDCNGGKTSSSPDAPLVADVAADALRWSRAMAVAAGEMLERASGGIDTRAHFEKVWGRYGTGTERRPLPMDPGWRSTVDSLLAAGLPMSLLEECIEIAMGQRRVAADNVFRYMCGVAWRKVREIQERARELAQEAPEDAQEAPEDGDDREDLEDAAVQRWCRAMLFRRRPEDIELATYRCRNYTKEENPDPDSILWFVIDGLEGDRAALYDVLRELVHALPGDVGSKLIQKHEAFYQSREGIPYNRYTALFTAAQHATEQVAHERARQEMALMPRDECETWIQRATDENADWLDHISQEYLVAEACRLAREAAHASREA